jgi:hypothetical protein
LHRATNHLDLLCNAFLRFLNLILPPVQALVYFNGKATGAIFNDFIFTPLIAHYLSLSLKDKIIAVFSVKIELTPSCQ